MMSETQNIRIIEPFSFWPKHASALNGFGGEEPSPDAFYCFHTPYHEFKPGILLYHVRFSGAKASVGEMALRVHAYRPDTDMNAVLVAGARAPLEGLDGDDFEMTVRVLALPGVVYAIYGRFSEPSDLDVGSVEIAAEEIGGGDFEAYFSADVGRCLFASELETPSHLLGTDEPSFADPTSQPCTIQQLESRECEELWAECADEAADPVARWRSAFSLQVLSVYGLMQPGASGAILAPEPTPLPRILSERNCLVHPFTSETLIGHFDFIVSIGLLNQATDSANLLHLVLDTLKHVLRGGLAIFIFDFEPAADAMRAENAPFLPTVQDIQRLALQVIGHGSDVAQLRFGGLLSGDIASAAPTPFGLIMRR